MSTPNIWQKNVRNTNCLEDEVCPVMVWLGKLTALDMTSLGWLVRKICCFFFLFFFSIGPSMPELCLFLAHLSSAQGELLWSLFACHPSVNIFKRLLLWSRWANFAQISYGASLRWGNQKLLKWWRFVDQDGCHAHIWWKPLKIFFSRTENALRLNLYRNHLGREVYQNC